MGTQTDNPTGGKAFDVIDVLPELFILRGIPGHTRETYLFGELPFCARCRTAVIVREFGSTMTICSSTMA